MSVEDRLKIIKEGGFFFEYGKKEYYLTEPLGQGINIPEEGAFRVVGVAETNPSTPESLQLVQRTEIGVFPTAILVK